MKAPLAALILSSVCSLASAKTKPPAPAYQDAVYQERHTESVRMNCYGAGYGSSMSTCHDAQMLVYTVKIGETVYTLTPYGALPHHESLWNQPAGAAVKAWNDGKHLHIRIGAKVSQYDVINESAEDATR